MEVRKIVEVREAATDKRRGRSEVSSSLPLRDCLEYLALIRDTDRVGTSPSVICMVSGVSRLHTS